MPVLERNFLKTLRKRLNEPNSFIQVVRGPRQVGKTTAIKSLIERPPEGLRGFYRSADSPTPISHEAILRWWKEAEASDCNLLVVDEVQKISGWSEALKLRWDQNDSMKVVVTGSSSLLLEKGLTETLAGRFETIHATHWNADEASSVFGLSVEKFIEYGCYPGSIRFLDDVERWGAYIRNSIVEPVLGRDLLLLHPIEQPALLRQIFGVAVSLPGQIVSLQKLQGMLQGKGSLPTIGNYLRLLKEAYVISGIEKYSSVPFRTRRSSPKLIIHDNALIRAFENPIGMDLSPERRGRYFENAVAARLIEAGWQVYYWAERSKEVDLVALGPQGQHWAIEVKSTQAESHEFKGLHDFCKKHPKFEPCLISLIEQQVEGIKSVKVDDVLSLGRAF